MRFLLVQRRVASNKKRRRIMRCKSILLGGALAAILAGAGYAQAASDNMPVKKPAHHAMVHRYRHAVHHQMQHTAMRAPETSAERAATYNLNREQLRPVDYAREAQYRTGTANGNPEPGRNTGFTPARRIPNGLSFQAATPAGGRGDTPALNSAHRL
jgi:hypothetical protein